MHNYDGRASEAWAVVEKMWSQLRRTMLLSHEMFRIEARWLRARCALALALQTRGKRRDSLLDDALRMGQRIRREEVRWGHGIAEALFGAVASLRGKDDVAIAHFATAEPLLEGANLESTVAIVRRARGLLLGGDEGGALIDDAQRWFDAQGVCDPPRFGAMYLPGNWDSG